MIKTLKRKIRAYLSTATEAAVAYVGTWAICHYVLEIPMNFGLWAAGMAISALVKQYEDSLPHEPDEEQDGY